MKRYGTKRLKQILLITTILFIQNNIDLTAQMTGWVDPATIAAPVTGDVSDWLVAAIATNGCFDNARLMQMSVYDYYSNTTFGTYMGGTNDYDAGIYVFSYNHTTQTQYGPRAVYIFSDNPESSYDGHSYPHIVKSLDGHIHVFFCDQSGLHNNVQIRFDERGTIQSDYTTTILTVGNHDFFGRPANSWIRGEYPKPFVARNGSMYFFSRFVPYEDQELSLSYGVAPYRVARRPQAYVKSNDNGLTWNPIKLAMLRSNETDYLTEPYLTQVTAEPQRDGVEERYHFTWTLAAGIALWINGTGNVQSDYHNAHSKNIYHAYFVPGEDNFYSMDGTNLGESILEEEMDNHCLAQQTLNNVYPLPMSLSQYAEIAGDNTSIMGNYTTVDGSGNTYVNVFNHWNGSSWEQISGDYPGEARIVEWQNGEFYAYNGNVVYNATVMAQSWGLYGGMDFSTTEVSDMLDDLGQVKGCPVPGPNRHPEAYLWVKAYPQSGTIYGGFVAMGGHRSSYVPDRIVVEVEKGTAGADEEVNVNAYVVDEYGARIMNATNEITFSTDIGSFSETNVAAYQGLSKSVLTISGSATLGEHKVYASAAGLTTGEVYITVAVPDLEAPSIPDNFTAVGIAGTQINLSWDAATDNVGIAGYYIYRDGEDLATTTTTRYFDQGLIPLTTYNYTIAAYDAAGNESAQSSPVSAATLDASVLSVQIPVLTSKDISAYPNPFRESTTIAIHNPVKGNIKVTICDIQGRKVDVICDETRNSGMNTFRYQPTNLSAGIYYLVVRTERGELTNKMIYLGN